MKITDVERYAITETMQHLVEGKGLSVRAASKEVGATLGRPSESIRDLYSKRRGPSLEQFVERSARKPTVRKVPTPTGELVARFPVLNSILVDDQRERERNWVVLMSNRQDVIPELLRGVITSEMGDMQEKRRGPNALPSEADFQESGKLPVLQRLLGLAT